jgi:peptidyl-prolyl cis-trans isomerase D
MAKIIIGLIVVFLLDFWYRIHYSSVTVVFAVAEVNGEEISPYALQQEVAVQQRQLLLAMLGDDADPALLDEAHVDASRHWKR